MVFIKGMAVEEVSDFKNIGSCIASTSKDIHVRGGLAWKALLTLNVLWNSDLSRKIKIFRTA